MSSLLDLDQSTLANMPAALSNVCRKLPSDRDNRAIGPAALEPFYSLGFQLMNEESGRKSHGGGKLIAKLDRKSLLRVEERFIRCEACSGWIDCCILRSNATIRAYQLQ